MDNRYKVKEFAAKGRVTVRALHHYDRLGLLRPGRRTRSGYRVYTDKDLLRLQQIVTLKFMGLTLGEIKTALARPRFSVLKSMRLQAEAVDKEIERLKRAARALREAARGLEAGRPIDWARITDIMEDLQMSEEMKKTWAKHITAEDEKDFAELGKRHTPESIRAYQEKWAALIEEVKANLKTDPSGPVGQALAKRWKDLLAEGGFGEFPRLSDKIASAYRAEWGAGNTQGPSMPFGPEIWEFIRKAMSKPCD